MKRYSDRFLIRVFLRWCGILAVAVGMILGPTMRQQTTEVAAAMPADAPPQPETVTLRWFLRWSDTRIETIAVPLIERFHAEHPTIRVVVENAGSGSDYYKQLRLQLMRGTAPDVFYPATHVVHDLARQGQLLPLNDLLRRAEIDLTAYDPVVLAPYYVGDQHTNDQQLYCLPLDQAALAVVYNRTLFDAADIPYPTAPWTWKDLRATAAALTKDTDGDGVPEQYGIDRFYTYWPLLVWSATGHNVFDDPKHPTEFLLEEEDSVNAIQWLADLHLQDQSMPPPEGIAGIVDPFISGLAAMQIVGHWRVPSYLATAGLNYDFVALPSDNYQVNRNDGSCFAIASATAHPLAAWEFVQFLAGPTGIGAQMLTDLQQITPALTALRKSAAFHDPSQLPEHNMSAFLAPDTNMAAAQSQLDETEDGIKNESITDTERYWFPLYDPLHPIFDEWKAIADTELQAVWSGERTADDAVGRMANQAEDLLETLADEPVFVDTGFVDTGLVDTVETSPTTTAHTIAPDDGNDGVDIRATVNVTETPEALLATTPLFTTTLRLTVSTPATASIVASQPSTVVLTTTQLLTDEVAAVAEAPLEQAPPEQAIIQSNIRFPSHYYVAPDGSDRYTGLRANFPLATIQHALELVAPGDTIHLAAGSYYENVTSVIHGRADAPITIMGPSDAIFHGNGDASAGFYLTHNYYTFTGFTMDGLHGDPAEQSGYTQKLLYVQGTGVKEGVTGLRVLNMTFRNAGGECLRLRYFAHHNEIAYSTFTVCGLLDYEFDDGGKNGEAIYVGTAPDQWADGKNPTADPDESSYNWIHHNVMDTHGNECAEIKEGGYGNVVEYNLCTGQLDPDSAGIGARGNHNIIRYNTIYSNVGAGVRLGGHEVDGIQYGIENEVYGNHLIGNRAGGLKIINEPQTRICGNRLERNIGKLIFGDGSDDYEPTAPC